jgi:hypothetical protein
MWIYKLSNELHVRCVLLLSTCLQLQLLFWGFLILLHPSVWNLFCKQTQQSIFVYYLFIPLNWQLKDQPRGTRCCWLGYNWIKHWAVLSTQNYIPLNRSCTDFLRYATIFGRACHWVYCLFGHICIWLIGFVVVDGECITWHTYNIMVVVPVLIGGTKLINCKWNIIN